MRFIMRNRIDDICAVIRLRNGNTQRAIGVGTGIDYCSAVFLFCEKDAVHVHPCGEKCTQVKKQRDCAQCAADTEQQFSMPCAKMHDFLDIGCKRHSVYPPYFYVMNQTGKTMMEYFVP